jgi:hypothetical protein
MQNGIAMNALRLVANRLFRIAFRLGFAGKIQGDIHRFEA